MDSISTCVSTISTAKVGSDMIVEQINMLSRLNWDNYFFLFVVVDVNQAGDKTSYV